MSCSNERAVANYIPLLRFNVPEPLGNINQSKKDCLHNLFRFTDIENKSKQAGAELNQAQSKPELCFD